MVAEGHSLRVIYHCIRAAGNLTNCNEKQFYYHVKRMRKADADSARLAAVDSIRYAVADIARLAAADGAQIVADSRNTSPRTEEKQSAHQAVDGQGYGAPKKSKVDQDWFARADS